MTVTVAIITHDSASVLADCLASLPNAFTGVEHWGVIIVDNDSRDGTLDMVAREAPWATVICHRENRGFAAGINSAVRMAPAGDAVLVLNPDTRLAAGTASRLLGALDDPGAGIAVPRLITGDGTLFPSLRREPTLLRALAAAVVGGTVAGRVGRLGEVIHDGRVYERAGTAVWATGAAMLVSAQCLRDVGLWDESLFLYSEETEFALRARDHGFRLVYVPEAEVTHLGGAGVTTPRLWALMAVNRVDIYCRRHGRLAAAAYRKAVLLNEALRWPLGPTHRMAFRAVRRRYRPGELAAP